MGNKPRIRFKGFTEDWEQRKLGSIGSTYTGLSGKTKEDFGHGEAQYITYLNVFQNTVSDITMTDKVEIDTTQNEVKYGDVLFTTSSETPEEVGMSSVWLGHMPNIYLNSFCFGFRPNQKIDPYFLGYSLRAPYMRDKIKILAQGISRYNISKNKVMELEISMPNNEEQKLLGTFLQHIDLIITLHQCKLEKLKLMKKALLQKLFPKNGKHIPEIRFKGFTDAWEQCKLGDLAEIVRGASPRPISDPKWFDNDSNVGWLRIADVTAQDGRIRYLEQKISELGQEKTRVIKTPHLLLSIAATVGKPVINYVPTGVHDGFLIFLNPKFNILYAFWWLEMFREKWNKYGQPGSQVNLNSDLVKNQVINIPNEKEQEKISSFLESLDKIITLHQQEPFLCGNSVNGGVVLC